MLEFQLSLVPSRSLSLDAWRQYIDADPAFKHPADELMSVGLTWQGDNVVWQGNVDIDMGVFHYRDGKVTTYLPTDALIIKMGQVAIDLEAQLICHDGLTYPKTYPEYTFSREEAYRYIRRVRRLDAQLKEPRGALYNLQARAGDAYINGNYAEALDCLVDLARADNERDRRSRKGWTDFAIGNCYRCLGRLDDAEIYYRSALHWGMPTGMGNDGCHYCFLTLGITLMKLGKSNEAKRSFDLVDRWNTPAMYEY